MKEIYIVLTHTGTNLSRMIKVFTKDEFTHISISLDADLKEMYSFGRLHPYNPIWGGFVHEYVDKGTFKRFYKTKTCIYSLKVTNEQYNSIKKLINKFENDNISYKFNFIGLVAVALHKRIIRKHSFYCAEFAKYALENANIKTNLPDIVKPEDFKYIKDINVVYKGLLREYPMSRINMIGFTNKNFANI